MSKTGKKEKKYIEGTKVTRASLIITSVVLAVLVALSSFAVVVFTAKPYDVKDGQVNVYKLTSRLYTEAIVAAMPKSITGYDNGRPVEFFIEVNDKYEVSDQPINQYRVYFFDKNDKKQVCVDGIYRGTAEDMYPLVGFFIQGMDNLKTLAKVLKIVKGVVIAVAVAFALYLIYLLWAISQDRKYSNSYQEKKRSKKLEKEQKKLQNKIEE